MNGLLEVLGKLGPQRLAAMAAVTIALVGFFAYVIFRVSQPTMTTLFTDLSVQDINTITRDLDQRGVRYEMRQDGATILVPHDQLLKLRLDLAGKGLPTGGGIGYEIFDKGDAFSTTSFVQNVNHVRALEGELARTIRALDRVQMARVHLVLPERQLFSREKNEARASIVVKTRGDLDAGQIRAIRHLTATAVPNLKPEAVSIVDEGGRLLADGAPSDDSAAADEKQTGYERRVRKQVEDIVASIVGQGRTRVQIAADMDFNRIQQTSEAFDPESRVVRSTQSRTESALTSENKDGQVSVGNELPGAKDANGDKAPVSKDASNKNEEIINYEISRTTRNEVIEAGRVKRISVAVLVDGVYVKGASGSDPVYQPRAQEELDRIAALVRSSVGFDAKRGDQVEVVNLKFAETPTVFDGREPSFWERMLNFSKDDVMRMAELGVLGVISLFVLLLVIRPLVKQMSAPEAGRANGQLALAAPGEEQALLEKVSLVDKVGDVVSKSPPEAVTILRQYIQGTA